MKAKLIFDLDDLDDKTSHLRCIKSLDLSLALYSISEKFRELRRASESSDEETKNEFTSDMFYEILSSYGIDLDEMVQ